MKCAECKNPISARDQKRAVFEHDDQGRVIAAYHHAHARRARAKRRTGGALPGKQYRSDAPSPYDVETERKEDEAMREHQDALKAARAEEEAPKGFSDWRDPETASLEDLTP